VLRRVVVSLLLGVVELELELGVEVELPVL
jgi:hypothetical protein